MLLDNDEIEVACDAIWFVERRGAVDAAQQRLWDRLQPLRTGDYGGSASADLTQEEASATLRALRYCADELPLDDDERRLPSAARDALTVHRLRAHAGSTRR